MADAWEAHKEKMTTLFLKQGKTLDEVRDEMEACGFHARYAASYTAPDLVNAMASKANYERRFKKWGVRKRSQNPKLKWTGISRKIEKRKAAGKQSEVYDKGIKLPSKKLCKEISRYCLPTMQPLYNAADSPKTPEGIFICTPAPSPDNIHLLRDLPWFKFLSSRGIECMNNLLVIRVILYAYPDIGDPNSDLASIAMMFVAVGSNMTPLLRTSITPGPTVDVLHGLYSAITNWTADIILNSQGSQVRKVHSYLRSVLPDPAHNDELELWKNKPEHFDPHKIALFINIFVYLLSNGLFEDAVYNKSVDIFRQPGMTDFLQTLLSNKTPTIEAFAEKIFIASIKSQDWQTIEIALKAGVDPNMTCIELNYTSLGYVAWKGNFMLVQLLLGAGANVNAPPAKSSGNTALQAAVKSENMDVVRLLLNVGADVNAPPAAYMYGYTALQEAARNGNIEVVRLLIDSGADINALAYGWHGRTALQAAAASENIEIVRLLLNAGADVNAPLAETGGYTALQAAAASGNIEIVRLLLNAGTDINAPPAEISGNTALQAAALSENIEIVRLLLNAGADVNAPPAETDGHTALQAAAISGNIEIVRLLLNAGANINAPPAKTSGYTALQAAAANMHIEIVRLLLSAGADINAPPAKTGGNTTLQVAARSKNIEIVRLLLNAGADVNAPPAEISGNTALQAAARSENIEIVRLLLNAGADVNAPLAETSGYTALQAAAASGNIEIVRLFLNAGADVNTPPADGYTPLQAAAKNCNIEITRLLLDAGADVNAPPADIFGRTALQAAAENGDIEIVELLLKAGADVNALPANSWGVTALQAAAIGGYGGIVLKFLDYNASVDAPGANNDGRTALEGAAEHGRLDIVQILLNAGVQLSGPGQEQYQRAIDFSAEEGHHAVERLIRDYARRDQVNKVDNSDLDIRRLTNIEEEFQSDVIESLWTQ